MRTSYNNIVTLGSLVHPGMRYIQGYYALRDYGIMPVALAIPPWSERTALIRAARAREYPRREQPNTCSNKSIMRIKSGFPILKLEKKNDVFDMDARSS